MSDAKRSGSGVEATSAKTARKPPASISGNPIPSKGILAGRDNATSSPTKNVRIKYARVYMIVEEVAHAHLRVGEAMLSLFLRSGECFAFPRGPIPSGLSLDRRACTHKSPCHVRSRAGTLGRLPVQFRAWPPGKLNT